MAETLRHYEDFEVGEKGRHGAYEFTAEEIKAFAREFDPQPFHLDEEAARQSILGGLCASGWHVCAVLNRAIVEGYISGAAGMGSFGLDEVRWQKPVMAGDVMSLEWELVAKRVSKSRPEMGILTFHWRMVDGEGTAKLTARGVNLVKVKGAS